MNKYILKMKNIATQGNKSILSKQWGGAKGIYNIKCNNCGFIDTLTYNAFLVRKPSVCDICSPSNSVKWSVRKCIAYVDFLNIGVKFLSEKYHKSIDEYTFKCLCGKIFERTWNSFYVSEAYLCRLCSTNTIEWSYTKCLMFAESKGVQLLSSSYNGYGEKHKFKCSCGRIFTNTWRDYYDRKFHKCLKCSTGKIDWDIGKVQELIEENSNSILLSKTYKNNGTNLQIRCGLCDTIFERTLNTILINNSCFCVECTTGRISWDINKVKDFVDTETRNILISTEYNTAHDKLEFYCECGNTFEKPWRDFKDLHQRYCRYCSNSISRGERIILEFLKDNNIEYIREYRNVDCRYKKPLPFDFYVPDNNILLEFDGMQHFRPVNFAGCSDEKALISHNNTVRNDEIKNKFAEKQGFRLIRIPYWEIDNIEEILEDLFNRQ